MSKYKVFEKQIYDSVTGEVFIEEQHYRYDSDDETFGMHRATEGVDWIFIFNGNELQMLIVLLEIEELKSGIVRMSPLIREHIRGKFNIKERMLSVIISGLESKNGLRKLSVSDYILNPRYFYKGGTKTFKSKLQRYLKLE